MDALDVKRVSDRLYLVDTLALGYRGTVAVYVLKASKIAVVDCGYASSYRKILESLSVIGISAADVRYLIPTHVHLDHSGGTGHLLKEMPNAEVIAHEKAVPHLMDPSRLIESATRVFGEEAIKLYGTPLPVDANRITSVGTEMHLDLGGGLSVTALHTPGHAPHQISLQVEEENALITADAVGIVYPSISALIPTTPPPSFDPNRAIMTVNELSQMEPKSLLVPHFGVRYDVANIFAATQDKIASWVSKVGSLRSRGLAFEEIVGEMVAEVAKEAKVQAKDLPEYPKFSIRVSVMGIVNYIERS